MNHDQDQDRYVFVNAPFDDTYIKRYFIPLIFTIYACGFKMLCGLDQDGVQFRPLALIRLINQCGYHLHDVSPALTNCSGRWWCRTKLPRLNMGFELGLQIGSNPDDIATKFGFGNTTQPGNQIPPTMCVKSPIHVITGSDHRLLTEYFSDFDGLQAESYNADHKELIRILRSWMNGNLEANGEIAPVAEKIIQQYEIFMKEAKVQGYDKTKFTPKKIRQDFSEFRNAIEKATDLLFQDTSVL